MIKTNKNLKLDGFKEIFWNALKDFKSKFGATSLIINFFISFILVNGLSVTFNIDLPKILGILGNFALFGVIIYFAFVSKWFVLIVFSNFKRIEEFLNAEN